MTTKAENKNSKSWRAAKIVTPQPPPVISAQRKVRIIESESTALEALESDLEQLLASMQTTRSKAAVKAAFKASPERLGRAAVKHARKKARRLPK